MITRWAVCTSWAGQDAQNRQISLCFAQFFDFGPEILTHDSEQARQDTTWRAQNKKNENLLNFRPFHDHGKRLAGRMSAVFFCFVELAKYWFGGLDTNHVSKFQVLTSKIERCMATFPPKCLCIQIYT